MTAFLIQALLWLLVAFLLGLGIGRFLKSLFCRAEVETIYSGGMAVPKPGAGRVNAPRPGVSATTAAVAGTAAAAAGAVAVARKKLAEAELPDVSLKAPAVDLPAVTLKVPTVDLPDVSLKVPEVDLPDVSLKAPEIDLPAVDVTTPDIKLAAPSLDIDLPDTDVQIPEVSLSARGTDLDLPEAGMQKPVIDFGTIDPHKPIVDPPDFNLELPEVSLAVPQLYDDLPAVSMQTTEAVAEETVTEEGSNWLGIATGTVVAVGAGLAAKAASALDFSTIDPHKPIVDPPDLDVELPEVSMTVPEMDVSLPEVSLAASDVELPDVTLVTPQLDADLPDMALQAPEASLSALETDISLPAMEGQKPAIDFSLIDPHKPIVDPPDFNLELPEVSLAVPQLYDDLPAVSMQATEAVAEETVTEEGSNWLGIATGTVVAAGAGLVATVASASDTVQDSVGAVIDHAQEAVGIDDAEEVESDDETDWLLLIVQRVKEEYQGLNPRAVSKLWDMDSGYDCSALERYDSLTLEPAHYDKLGSTHCGVPRAGFVAVGGDVSNIEPGTAILFHYPNVVVCRDADDNHHFIRVTH